MNYKFLVESANEAIVLIILIPLIVFALIVNCICDVCVEIHRWFSWRKYDHYSKGILYEDNQERNDK